MSDSPYPSMTSTSHPPRYRWVVFGVWVICSVSGFMVVSTVGILLPSISSDLHLSPAQQGILGSAAFWGNLALAIPLTWWASRFRLKPLTTLTLALGTCSLFLQGWSPIFIVLILGRLTFGLSVVAREPARAMLLRQWFRPHEVIWAQSIGAAMFGVVVGGGILVTPYILDAFGDSWRATFNIFAIAFVILTVIWIISGREQAELEADSTNQSQSGIIQRALSYRDVWITSFGFLGATFAWSGFVGFLPTLLLESSDISLHWSGLILAIFIIIGGVAGLFLARAAMAVNNRRYFLQSLGILMACTYIGMTLTSSVPLLLILSVLNGLAWGFWPILHSVPFQLPGIRTREIAVALALITMMIAAGTALGPLVTGFLQETTGSLKTALVIIGVAPISLTISGTLLSLMAQQVRPVSS
ncbi:MFS transporter [SAR202 cluster bacterium AD-804-J14_MRT_500m]|nr:MFS transporter [SAR202 cluster bacterium AD-804-J14_MRT_500m]